MHVLSHTPERSGESLIYYDHSITCTLSKRVRIFLAKKIKQQAASDTRDSTFIATVAVNLVSNGQVICRWAILQAFAQLSRAGQRHEFWKMSSRVFFWACMLCYNFEVMFVVLNSCFQAVISICWTLRERHHQHRVVSDKRRVFFTLLFKIYTVCLMCIALVYIQGGPIKTAHLSTPIRVSEMPEEFDWNHIFV